MKRFLSYSALCLGIAQLLLILSSWILTAAMPDVAMRSLLSSEGIRWFFGNFVENLATPVLVWMLLIGIAYGAFQYSGLAACITQRQPRSYRERFALRMVAVEVLLLVGIVMLLTLLPQGILLSVTGNLFPSSFSKSVVAIIAFIVSLASVSYGMLSGRTNTLESVFSSLTAGMIYLAPFCILYVLAAQLYFSAKFVFGI